MNRKKVVLSFCLNLQHDVKYIKSYGQLPKQQGATSLSDFFTTNRQLVEQYIKQFDKATDAKKNLQERYRKVFKWKSPLRKRNPGVQLDIKEAWVNARAKREAEI
ncbi:hypothetical protein BDF20DRAFT_464131 [Mycotypha africana]|uniref:uncharacterized protein n=1 Tax=Mycotypha africana TaxID=64632 RepID=UPI0022FFD0B4|nr:uncharacterized protein BDF20DRAFT_464131 [Mycotypha africana]KAI8982316.1 hypothetical protein BDF20DRAFT_464131 [Mycotypha africana]